MNERITTFHPGNRVEIFHTGHVTRGNFFCNLSHNDDNWKTLQVAAGVSHVRNIFSQLAMPPLELFTTLSPPAWISCEKKKGHDCLIFTKLCCRFWWTCHTQDISTFLATCNATFCCCCRLQNWGVTRDIFLATCPASCKKNCLV